MDGTTHIIKAQEFQIEIADEKEAYRVQTAISGLQSTHINALLEEIMNTYDDPEYIFQFKTIELDLGTINTSNYEQELVYRLEEELSKYFENAIGDNGKLREGKKIVLQDRSIEEFEHFLLRGFYNWNTGDSKTPSELLLHLIKTQKEALLNLLHLHAKKEAIRKRMIFQFKDETLEAVIVAAIGSDSKPIIAYKNKVVSLQKKKPLVASGNSSFRAVIWEIILAYIFAESRSYFDKKSFLQYLIQKMAGKYNVKYSALLAGISAGILEDQHLSDNNSEFKQIILELSNQQQSTPDNTTKLTPEEQANIDWIAQLDHFLNYGIFKWDARVSSKSVFNSQFRKKLNTGNVYLLRELDNWLKKPLKKKRLLLLSTNEVINTIVETSKLPYIVKALSFIESLGLNSGSMSQKSVEVLSRIKQSKGRFILQIDVTENFSEKQIIDALLKSVFKTANETEHIVFRFLYEAKPSLSEKHQSIIANFLMNFYQNMGAIVLERISNSFQDFSGKNRLELWAPWLTHKIKTWEYSTGLTKEKLLLYLTENLQRSNNSSRNQLVGFIEQYKNIPTDTVPANFVFDDFRNAMNQNKSNILNPDKKQLVYHILKYGTLPWWARHYTNIRFNEDLAKLIAAENKSVLLKFIKEHNACTVSSALLNNKNQYALWRVMDNSAGSAKANILHKINEFIESTLLPSGSVSEQQHREFKLEVLSILLNTSEVDFRESLMKFLKAWGVSSELYVHKSLTELFEAQLSVIAQINPKSGAKNKSSEVKPNQLNTLTGKALINYLKAYDSAFSNVSFSEENIAVLLEQFSVSNAVKFDQLLEQKTFRELLVQELPKKTMREIITTRISSKQAHAFKQARSFPESVKKQLSDIAQINPKSGAKNKPSEVKPNQLNTLTGKALINYLKAYDSAFSNVSFSEENIAVLLEQFSVSNAVKFDRLLEQKTFRELLVQELPQKTMREIITTRISSKQTHAFKQATSFLESVKKQLSTQQYDQVKRLFSALLLLKISAGGINFWGIETWSRLIVHVLKTVLGIAKSSQLFFSLSEEYRTKNGTNEIAASISNITKSGKENSKIPITETVEEIDIPYKKLGEESTYEFIDPIFINNAGLIILASHLGTLFERCGLMERSQFIDDESRHKAALLLEFAVMGATPPEQSSLMLNKVLCGIAMNNPINRNIELEPASLEIVNSMLSAITQQWSTLKNTSIEGLQGTFLQRDGKLEEGEDNFYLFVEKKTVDMLMDSIPWNISKIKLSWMEKILEVTWR